MPKVSDLFEIHSGNAIFVDLEEDPKGFAFVSATRNNNNIFSRVKFTSGMRVFNSGCITVPCKGESSLYACVQTEDFVPSNNVKVLVPKVDIPLIVKWFYCYCLRQHTQFYSYGRTIVAYLPNIELPDNIPDWVYDCKLDLPKTEVGSEIPELHTENWKSFKLGDLFNITRGSFNTMPEECTDAEVQLRLVGRSISDNGIWPTTFGCTRQYFDLMHSGMSGFHKYFRQNSLAVLTDGDAGFTTFQYGGFVASSKAAILTPKSFRLSPHIGLFIATFIRVQRGLWGNNRIYTPEMIANTRIKLPATPTGEPDWNFMELYMRSLPYSDLIKDI